jgi:carbonic anhydrase
LAPLKKLGRENKSELEGIADQGVRAARLAELNVAAGVETLLSNTVVEDAVKERGLLVHGVLFDIASGKLRDLRVGKSKREVAESANLGK